MATLFQECFPRVTASALRALVVDDHHLVADAMATAISALRIFERVDSASSLAAASAMLEANPVCNLLVVDLHVRGGSGRATVAGLRQEFPQIPVLVFSGDESLESITLAFECGARGYVSKRSPLSDVASAMRSVIAGGSHIPSEAVEMLGYGAPSADTRPIQLTGRQRQVLRLLLQGMPNTVIGSRLAMAEGTVTAHLNTVFRELGVSTRVEAILRARQLGIQ